VPFLVASPHPPAPLFRYIIRQCEYIFNFNFLFARKKFSARSSKVRSVSGRMEEEVSGKSVRKSSDFLTVLVIKTKFSYIKPLKKRCTSIRLIPANFLASPLQMAIFCEYDFFPNSISHNHDIWHSPSEKNDEK
jgi:hypothetical protein